MSHGKISKTGKYWGNGKPRKNKKQRSTCSFKSQLYQKSGLYQTRERLALYPSEATTIFHLLAASGFFNTTILG